MNLRMKEVSDISISFMLIEVFALNNKLTVLSYFFVINSEGSPRMRGRGRGSRGRGRGRGRGIAPLLL